MFRKYSSKQVKMVFSISGKVALITGGASGLGLSFCNELLSQNLRGLAIADIDYNLGQSVVQDLNEKYGDGKVIFIKTDVTDMQQFKNAFQETVSAFGNLDILINNAGILDDHQWQRELQINLTGTVNGIILGLEDYLQKYRSGANSVIANVCSVAGIGGKVAFPCPLYTASKYAVHGLTISFGCPEQYERTKVRVVAICPGVTATPLIENFVNRSLGEFYDELTVKYLKTHTVQRPETCAKAMAKIIEKAPPGTLWVSEGGQEPYQYELPDRFQIPQVYLD